MIYQNISSYENRRPKIYILGVVKSFRELLRNLWNFQIFSNSYIIMELSSTAECSSNSAVEEPKPLVIRWFSAAYKKLSKLFKLHVCCVGVYMCTRSWFQNGRFLKNFLSCGIRRKIKIWLTFEFWQNTLINYRHFWKNIYFIILRSEVGTYRYLIIFLLY